MNDVFVARVEKRTKSVSPAQSMMDAVMALATTEAVPTGRLLRAPQALPLADLDGSDDSPAITQEEWQLVFSNLRSSALENADGASPGGGMPALEEMLARAAAHRELGYVPIFAAGYAYEAVRNRVWVAMERQESTGVTGQLPFSKTTDLFESRRAFLASAILESQYAAFTGEPVVHYGAELTFILPSDGLLGDAAGGEITVDFCDGEGPRPVRVDEPETVKYAAFGSKVITIQSSGPDGVRSASFRLSVAEETLFGLPANYHAVPRDKVTATIAWPDYPLGEAQALVIKERNKPKITKPIVIAEGFPFNYPWAEIWHYAVQNSFAVKLLEKGYDLVLVRFPKGAIRVQANAYALIAQIYAVIAEREGTEQLIVGGFSMGGMIARYALAYIEHEKLPSHQTARLFTVDTPHEGANVAIAVQSLVQMETPDSEQGILMRTDSAKQMLRVHVEGPGPWPDGHQFTAHWLRTELVNELERVQSMPNIDTIATACGAGNGAFNQAPPTVYTTGYRVGGIFADVYFSGAYAGETALLMCRRLVGDFNWYRTVSVTGFATDSAPGSIWERPIFRRVYEGAFCGGIKPRYENCCFVPTISALAIPGTDYFRVPDLRLSKFKKVTYSWFGNRTHIELIPSHVEFLLEFLTAPAGAVAEATAE